MNYIKDLIDYICKIFKWWIIVLPWQNGIRVRRGKIIKIMSAGIYLKIPIIDEVFIQTTRLRILSLPLQTVSTKDKQTITVAAVAGYSITDIKKMYDSIHQPEGTICNTVLSEMANHIANTNMNECEPHKIEQAVIDKLQDVQYGIKFETVKIVGFANVKTFRLIQDSHWMPDNITLDNIESK